MAASDEAKGGTGERSLNSIAYDQIRRAILSLELRPGEALSENRLAQMLQISRTPIREALRQLERDGLVRFAPPKGAFVAELTSRDVVEIFQVREALEGAAARMAAERMPLPEIDALQADHDRWVVPTGPGWEEHVIAADFRLHQRIIRATGNRRLAQYLATLEAQLHGLRQFAQPDASRLADLLAEHQRILDALRTRDGDAAEAAMKRHLWTARENVARGVDLMWSYYENGDRE